MQQADSTYKTLQAVLIGRFSEDGNIVNFNTYGTAAGLFIDSDSNDKIYQLNAEVDNAIRYTVDFTDNLGNVICTLNVAEGGIIDSSMIPAVAERYGYKFVGWSSDVNMPIFADMVITALYEKNTDVDYGVSASGDNNVVIKFPENQERVYYNDRITVSAPQTNNKGEKFAYWKINGSAFSYMPSISFLVFDELDIEAVYSEGIEENPVVIYTNTRSNYAINGNKWDLRVMGVVSADESAVTEIGILLSASEMTSAEMLSGYNANNGTVYKMASGNFEANRQFIYSVKNIALDRTRCATVYAIIDGEMVVGDAVTCVTIDSDGLLVA